MTHKKNYDWKISTQALHAGEEQKYADAHITPIFSSSTFMFPNTDIGGKRFTGGDDGFIYGRLGNPTVLASEKKIAVLEGLSLLRKGNPVEGHAFSTGMAAISTSLLALTSANSEIISGNPIYGGTNYLLDGILTKFNIKTHYTDTSGENGIENIKKHLSPKIDVIYLESPANPNLAITDIEAVSKLAKEHSIPVVVDNTFSTPYLQRPLELGADISVHSTTKYLNGHGTTVSGILATSLIGENLNKLRYVKKNLGATQSPFDAFLVLNGMKTLPIRMDKHSSNAMAVAEYLEDHPKVETVYYPGLSSHPHHNIAEKQMHGQYSGMVACGLKGGFSAGETLMNNVEVFTLAVSLGCIDSLIQHPASMTHVGVPKDVRLAGGLTDGLVRLSIGIEDVDDLIEDISQALSKV